MHLATLVTTARNEGPYFWEWVAYHRMIGFEKFIIYQNDSDDLTHAILKSLENAGVIRYFYNKAGFSGHQVQAYQRCTHVREYTEADYIMALDMDEFLHIKTDEGTLPSLLKVLPDVDAMYFNWRNFGSSGFTRSNNELVTRRFVRAHPDSPNAAGLKTLYKRDKYRRPGIHAPVASEDTDKDSHTNGSGMKAGSFVVADWRCGDPEKRKYAQVNHYVIKDAESFILKVARGRAHQANNKIDKGYWQRFDHNQTIDTGLAGRNFELLQAMEALDAETGGELSDLTHRSKMRHRKTFERLIEDPVYRDLYDFCVQSNTPATPKGPVKIRIEHVGDT